MSDEKRTQQGSRSIAQDASIKNNLKSEPKGERPPPPKPQEAPKPKEQQKSGNK